MAHIQRHEVARYGIKLITNLNVSSRSKTLYIRSVIFKEALGFRYAATPPLGKRIFVCNYSFRHCSRGGYKLVGIYDQSANTPGV